MEAIDRGNDLSGVDDSLHELPEIAEGHAAVQTFRNHVRFLEVVTQEAELEGIFAFRVENVVIERKEILHVVCGRGSQETDGRNIAAGTDRAQASSQLMTSSDRPAGQTDSKP